MWDRVAISLHLLPTLPSALTLELQERGTGNTHEVRGPGVTHEVRGECASPGSAMDALEQLGEPVLGVRIAGAGREQRRARLAVGAAVTEESVEVTRHGWMQEDRPALAELRGLGTNVQLAALQVKIANARLAQLVEPKAEPKPRTQTARGTSPRWNAALITDSRSRSLNGRRTSSSTFPRLT